MDLGKIIGENLRRLRTERNLSLGCLLYTSVVALVEDSATVKTFYKEDGHIRLQPENDSMDPIILDDVQILGKVFGVFRMFN